MGAEELDSDEMEPFIAAVEKETIKGKNIILFGSYDWGDGQWMREWEDRMKTAGAVVIKNLIVQNTPDEDDILKCKELGRELSV
jgi:flavorubredoxin